MPTAKYTISADDKSKVAITSARKNLKSLRAGINSTKTAIAGLAGAAGLGLLSKALIGQVNTYDSLSNRLKLVTKDAEELASVQETLFTVSQDTRGSLEGTIDLYTRFARSTKKLNLSQEELAAITSTVNKTLIISGSSTQAANAAVIQLGQGLASGVLRGQELNSILEQTPRLAQALADGMGVATGQLKELGEQGKITSAAVVAALKSQSNSVQVEFGKMNKTIAQSLIQIENEFLRTFGTTDSGGLVQSLDEFRAIISDPDVAKGLSAIATGLISITAATAGSIGGLAAFGTNIGKFVAGGDTRTLDEKISAQERRLARANRELARNDRFFRTDATKEEVSNKFQSEMKELKALYDLKRGYEETAKAAEALKSAKPERQTVTSGSAFGTPGENPSIKSLETYANELNKERELLKLHEIEKNAMVTKYTDERIRYAEEEQRIKLQVLSSGLGAASSILANVSALMSKEGKKQTEVTRALARLSIVASTAQAVMNALAVSPYPLGVTLAVDAGLKGARELAKVGGSGGATNVSGLTQTSTAVNMGVPPATPTTQGQSRQIKIYFTGDNYGYDDFSEKVSDIIKDAVNDKDVVFINSDSRQAQEIREGV